MTKQLLPKQQQISSTATTTTTTTTQWQSIVRFGHYCFQQGQHNKAATCYKQALQQALQLRQQQQQQQQNNNISGDMIDDIRHALGALELAKGNFLNAQHIWKDAGAAIAAGNNNNNNNDNCTTNHPGIALQLIKQKAYKYFYHQQQQSPPTPNNSNTNSNKTTYKSQSYFDNQCFVTSMLTKSQCNKLIDIANRYGKWTTGRHYAVPTNDIPLHQVPEILEDWFLPWMEQECEPLVMQQFQVPVSVEQSQSQSQSQYHNQRFYVHDAFVVRYQAAVGGGGGEEGKGQGQGQGQLARCNNHLPCHLDECTHSFIVCLNKDFQGGGTYFHDYNTVISPNVGDVITFKGDTLRHGGDAVTFGTRYILAVFLYLDRSSSSSSSSTTTTTTTTTAAGGENETETANNNTNNNHDGARACWKRRQQHEAKKNGETNQTPGKHQIQPLFQEAKKQKIDFSFGFDL